MKTAEETLELYFGSDFYQLRESGILPFILAAMEEYKAQPLDKLIESAFKAGRSKQSWASFMEEYKSQSSEKEKEGEVTIDELAIELEDKRIAGLNEHVWHLYKKHTAEHLLDNFTITRKTNPPKV